MNVTVARQIATDVETVTAGPLSARLTIAAPLNMVLASLASKLEAAGFDVIGVESEFLSPEAGGRRLPCVLLVAANARKLASAEERVPPAAVLCAIASESDDGKTVVRSFMAAGSATRGVEPSLGDVESLASRARRSRPLRIASTSDAVLDDLDNPARPRDSSGPSGTRRRS